MDTLCRAGKNRRMRTGTGSGSCSTCSGTDSGREQFRIRFLQPELRFLRDPVHSQ